MGKELVISRIFYSLEMKIKEGEKMHNYLDLVRELKKFE